MDVLKEFWVEVMLCVVALIYSGAFAWTHWKENPIWSDARGFKDRIKDIRALNTYNSYMLAGIMVFLAFAANPPIAATPVPPEAVSVILVALLCAGIGIVFIPIGQPADLNSDNRVVKALWFKTVIFSQFTVILTIAGIARVVVAK